MSKSKKIFILVGLLVSLGLSTLPLYHTKAKRVIYEITKPDVAPPDPVAIETFEKEVAHATAIAEVQSVESDPEVEEGGEEKATRPAFLFKRPQLKRSINLAVPYTTQAPFGNWALPYQEACEEASMIMAVKFLEGESAISQAEADKAIQELIAFEEQNGYAIDITAEETAQIIRDYFNLEARVIYDFTEDDIKRAVSEGRPVIMPFAGRQLGNPHYRSPGPLYHMMVIRGYVDDVFIANDPGTRHGKEFQYTAKKIMEANHDWNDGDVANGQKVMITVSKKEAN